MSEETALWQKATVVVESDDWYGPYVCHGVSTQSTRPGFFVVRLSPVAGSREAGL
jgi:hypothetical protein